MSDLTILDNEEELKNDKEPTPGEKPKRRGRPPGSKSKTQANFIKEFEGELDAMLKMMAMMWSMRDPVCGPVLNEQSQLIAHDIAELAATSEKAREYLTKTMGIGKVVPLMMHTMPLLVTIREHHLTPRTEADADDDGTYPMA